MSMRKKPGEFSVEDGVEIEWVTKSEMKREADKLDKLALQLLDYTEEQLSELPLGDELWSDIRLARKIRNTHEGFRRQMQLIGKRLRITDSDPLYTAINVLNNKHLRVTQTLHKLELLRDNVIANGDVCINEIMDKHPQIDRQRLRQLARQANKELKQNKAPKASRELFKYLREEIKE